MDGGGGSSSGADSTVGWLEAEVGGTWVDEVELRASDCNDVDASSPRYAVVAAVSESSSPRARRTEDLKSSWLVPAVRCWTSCPLLCHCISRVADVDKTDEAHCMITSVGI